jgi:hypothetical protein
MDITRQQMISIISNNVKGTSAVTVDLDSPLDAKGKMRKGGNDFYGEGIVKRIKLNGMIGYNYGNAVNRLASKEDKDEREAKRHPWGDMDDKRLFRTHRNNGNKYLSMKVQTAKTIGFFRPDGSELTEAEVEQIKTFIPTKRKSSTQADLDGEVIARDFAVTNMTGILFKGTYLSLVEGQVEQETTETDDDEEQETETE